MKAGKFFTTVQPTAKLTHESAETRVFFNFIRAIGQNLRATRKSQNHPCRVVLHASFDFCRASTGVFHESCYVHLQE